MSEAAGRPASSEDVAPGRLLARLRTERKLSVADVAQRLKYGARQIEALEAEEFSRLPGTTFVRGMIRGYAKLLEIDPEPLLKSLDKRQIPGTATVDLRAKRVPFPDGTKRRGTRTYAILSLLVLAAVGGVLYEWHTGGLPAMPRSFRPELALAPAAPEPAAAAPVVPVQAVPEKPAAAVPAPAAAAPAPAPAAPQPQVAATPQAKASPPPVKASPPAVKAAPPVKASTAVATGEAKSVSGHGRIFMAFADDAWVEIKDGEGNLLMAQLNPAGSSRVVLGEPPFSLVIGNAAAVRVVYNEKAVDLTPYVKVEVARFTLK
jgi:cytoskeleton protein RodZ